MAKENETQEEEVAQEMELGRQAYMQQNPISTYVDEGGFTGVGSGYMPPPQQRVPVVKREKGKWIPNISFEKRSVSGIYDPKTGEVRPFYNLNTRPAEILGSLKEESRMQLTRTLYERGWYKGAKMEGGFGDNDREALRELLFFSNTQGLDYVTVLNTLPSAPISDANASSGLGPRVSSRQDLVEVANRTALSVIGRKLTKEEADRFAASYQGVQASDSGREAAPSADVFFQQRIEQKYGAESESYKYLNAISNVSKLLGGI